MNAKINNKQPPLKGASPANIERQWAEMGLGIVFALRQGRISVEKAQEDMLNLSTYESAERMKLDRNLLKFIEWGMELSDVKEVAPEGLEASFNTMTRLAFKVLGKSSGGRKKLPPAGTAHKSWPGKMPALRPTAGSGRKSRVTA